MGILLVGPIIVGLHVSFADDQQELSLYLFDAPTMARLAPVGHLLNPTFLHPRTSFELSAFFTSDEEEGRRGQALGTKALDSIYRFLIPFVMILVGANILPHQDRFYGSLFSLPGGRSAQFLLHLAALLALVLLLSLSIFALNALTLLVAFGGASMGESLPLLFEYHVVLLLYAICFSSLGFAAAIAFNKRETSIIFAVAIAVMLIVAIPQIYLTAGQNYVRSQMDRVQQTGTFEEIADDPLYIAIQSLGRLPASEYSMALEYLPELHRSEESSCATCTSLDEKRSMKNRAFTSLAAFSVVLLSFGGALFMRKEVGQA